MNVLRTHSWARKETAKAVWSDMSPTPTPPLSLFLSLLISCPGRAGCLLWFWPVSLAGWQLIDIQKHGLLSRVCFCGLRNRHWQAGIDVFHLMIFTDRQQKGQIIIQIFYAEKCIEVRAVAVLAEGPVPPGSPSGCPKFGLVSHQTIFWNWMFCPVATGQNSLEKNSHEKKILNKLKLHVSTDTVSQ